MIKKIALLLIFFSGGLMAAPLDSFSVKMTQLSSGSPKIVAKGIAKSSASYTSSFTITTTINGGQQTLNISPSAPSGKIGSATANTGLLEARMCGDNTVEVTLTKKGVWNQGNSVKIVVYDGNNSFIGQAANIQAQTCLGDGGCTGGF